MTGAWFEVTSVKHRSLLALDAAAIVTLAVNGAQAQTYVNAFNGMQPGGSQYSPANVSALVQYYTSFTGGNLNGVAVHGHRFDQHGHEAIRAVFRDGHDEGDRQHSVQLVRYGQRLG